MFGLGTMAGALLGGAIVDGGIWLGAHSSLSTALRGELTLFPWHLVFWINIPVAAMALALAFRLASDEPTQESIGLDVGAIVLIPAAAFCLMMAANGSRPGS
jgi:hypothetical protein